MEKMLKNDKRSLRTRSVIKKAVMVLLKTKRTEEIGISEIAKIALISRNSFYTHYNTVYDVLDDIFNDIIIRIDLILNRYEYNDFIANPFPLLKELSSTLVDNQAFSEYVVFSKNSTVLVQGIIDALTDKFYSIYKNNRVESLKVSYLINFIVSGSVQFVYKWFKDDKPVSFDGVLMQVSALVKEGVKMIREVKNTY